MDESLFEQMCDQLNLNPNHVESLSFYLERDKLPVMRVIAEIPQENSAALKLREFEVREVTDEWRAGMSAIAAWRERYGG